jgi:heme/copper-type cytochrome/quinol oxidase subunit 1
MTRREVAFLLIGLGTGLVFAVAVVIEFVMWFHHMFIVGISWRPGSIVLAVPFLLILIGSTLLIRSKGQRNAG